MLLRVADALDTARLRPDVPALRRNPRRTPWPAEQRRAFAVEKGHTMSDQPVTRPTKAIVAGVVALSGSLAVAAADNAITLGEALIALAATATAVGAVYGVTNKPVEDDGGDHEGGQE